MDTTDQYFGCLCRTCMNKLIEASSIDGESEPQQQSQFIFDMIEEEYGRLRIVELLSQAVPKLELQLSDELPKKICCKCLQQLLSVYRFQQMCLQSEQQMRQQVSKNKTDLSIPAATVAGDIGIQTFPLDNSSIQEPLLETTALVVKAEAAETSDVDHLLNIDQILDDCKDSPGSFIKFVKNEPIEDDEPEMEYSDGDTIISVKDEILAKESEEKKKETIYKCKQDTRMTSQGDLTYTCVEEETDLLNLLKEFDLETLFRGLKNAGITFRSLKYLAKEDIAEAVKNIGLRAEFREKLFFWRKSKFGIEDETLSQTSKVVGWLEKNRHKDSPCSSNNSIRNAFGSQPLSTFLNDNSAGKQLIQYYEERACFTNKQRDALIKIILEDVMLTKTKLRPQHFASIVEEIIGLFPNEKESQDYYYIPRQRKKNPSGKLFSKYFNLKTKIRKSSPSAERSLSSEVRDPLVEENVEVDETLSLCLKTSLQKDVSNWDEVIDKWQKTFTFRKKDLAKLSNSDFLQEWPILKDSRAPFLINLDFNLIYPQKDNLLKTKWDNFKTKIVNYYYANIRNQQSIDLLKQAKTTKKIDCQDYIFTILLNSVLLPSARFSVDGNTKKKATIKDANESFVLQLTTISDYSIRIKEIIGKYFYNKLALQPFIIVVGDSEDDLKTFYIYFDKTLYKLNSFIESLDICFKIFHVFNLKYPKICEMPWMFIQKYFYELDSKFDLKSSNLTSLLTHMNEKN